MGPRTSFADSGFQGDSMCAATPWATFGPRSRETTRRDASIRNGFLQEPLENDEDSKRHDRHPRHAEGPEQRLSAR